MSWFVRSLADTKIANQVGPNSSIFVRLVAVTAASVPQKQKLHAARRLKSLASKCALLLLGGSRP